jgi:hypothetical protein
MGGMRVFLVVAVGAALVSATAAAGDIGVAQATGYFKKDTRPTLYQPLNILDARDITAWCTPTGDPLNDSLVVGFNGPITLDEVRITTGNNFDETTFQSFGRAKKVRITSGKEERLVMLEDQRGPQAIPLSKPLTGSRFLLEVLDTHLGEDPEMPVCLTDVVFVEEGKQLNGPWLTRKLKYDRQQALVLGVWYGGYQGNPDHFLHFNFDGTFRYSYEPYDTERNKPKALQGTYDVSSSRISFQVGKKRFTARYAKSDARGGGQTLSFDGEVPAELKQVFRSVR